MGYTPFSNVGSTTSVAQHRSLPLKIGTKPNRLNVARIPLNADPFTPRLVADLRNDHLISPRSLIRSRKHQTRKAYLQRVAEGAIGGNTDSAIGRCLTCDGIPDFYFDGGYKIIGADEWCCGVAGASEEATGD